MTSQDRPKPPDKKIKKAQRAATQEFIADYKAQLRESYAKLTKANEDNKQLRSEATALRLELKKLKLCIPLFRPVVVGTIALAALDHTSEHKSSDAVSI